jgi:DNA-binding transcriptional ArsR family regulator
VQVYALVELGDQEAIDVYLRREDALAALAECVRDEPDASCSRVVEAMEPVPRRELVKLTEELFQAYLNTERTLTRDLNALERMRLIRRVKGGWLSEREQILAFMPLRRVEEIPR